MQFTKRIFSAFIVLTIMLSGLQSYSQEMNVITTGVPFLNISPDARGGSMGDIGVSTSPDANSMYWNPAKYAFTEKSGGLAIQYSPWLRGLVDDMGLSGLAGYYRIDEQQVIAGSLRYFSLGNIEFRNSNGGSEGDYSPNELALDVAYSRKLSNNLSLAISARYIRSNLTLGQTVGSVTTKPATSWATDISLFYWKDISLGEYDGRFAFGTNISNIGTKITYSEFISGEDGKDFIPTNLRFGPSLTMDLDEYNSLTFAIDINKLLVPTPPKYGEDGETIIAGYDDNVSTVTGMFQSFYDGHTTGEELREYNISAGVEYWYDNVFAVRAGYFHEHETKGNRKFFTAGAGLKYNVFNLDFSYLIPVAQQHPLDQTLRFTLSWDFSAL